MMTSKPSDAMRQALRDALSSGEPVPPGPTLAGLIRRGLAYQHHDQGRGTLTPQGVELAESLTEGGQVMHPPDSEDRPRPELDVFVRQDAGARERRLALGRLAYEEFASRRIALAGETGGRVSMPAWRAGPVAFGTPQTELDDREREIWAHVAEAVAAAIPFVLTEDVEQAGADASRKVSISTIESRRRAAIRAAAHAAGFRVVEQ